MLLCEALRSTSPSRQLEKNNAASAKILQKTPCKEAGRFYNCKYHIRNTHDEIRDTKRGCSSVVERHVANVNVVGSSPITRFVSS